MKTYGGVDVQIHVFITSALVGGEWSASRPGRLTPCKDPRYPLDRRLDGPQIRSGWYEEVKILYPTGTWTPVSRTLSQQSVAIPTELPRLFHFPVVSYIIWNLRKPTALFPTLLHAVFLLQVFLGSEKLTRHVPPKRLFTFNGLHRDMYPRRQSSSVSIQ
jgi:hypothetical protein